VLESEKQAYESRREHLQAEVLRLETEKNRILSEIKELESRAQESERLRAEIADLRIQHRTAEGKLREINREIEQLEINRDNLANEVARKEAEIFRKNQQLVELERRIRELKQEIVDIENSAKVALQILEKPILGLVNVRLKDIDENNFLVAFSKFLQNKCLNFHERIVKAFHTSLKVQDISALVVLAGISGTGKSELPQKYADFIGAPLVMLPVQPRWDSPQDLQGFYNYIEKKYKPTELMHYLYQYQQDPKMEGRIILVLLDEMNLARVEYYFSDFLSKLETRRSKDTYLPLDVGSLNLPQKQCEILI
jgi:5-methylcytosine-specific restriction endonuclease McrBC GTP-binding regulatory subunit McrB